MSFIQNLLHLALQHQAELSVGGLSLLGYFVGSSVVRRRRIAEAAHIGYLATKTVESELPPDAATTFDPVVAALKAADDYMVAHGWRGLSEDESHVAKLAIQAHHGQALIGAEIIPLTKPKGLVRLAMLLGLCAVAGVLLLGSGARASGFDWSSGPTLPFLEYDWGNPHPVQVAPGAGVQVSITHDALKRAFFGKSWDLADLQLAAFGSVVSASSGQQFGTFSASAGVCTLSSLLCVGVGKHLLSADQSFTHGGWFLTLSFSVNFGFAPTAPPTGVESGPAGLPRGNYLYFGAP